MIRRCPDEDLTVPHRFCRKRKGLQMRKLQGRGLKSKLVTGLKRCAHPSEAFIYASSCLITNRREKGLWVFFPPCSPPPAHKRSSFPNPPSCRRRLLPRRGPESLEPNALEAGHRLWAACRRMPPSRKGWGTAHPNPHLRSYSGRVAPPSGSERCRGARRMAPRCGSPPGTGAPRTPCGPQGPARPPENRTTPILHSRIPPHITGPCDPEGSDGPAAAAGGAGSAPFGIVAQGVSLDTKA